MTLILLTLRIKPHLQLMELQACICSKSWSYVPTLLPACSFLASCPSYQLLLRVSTELASIDISFLFRFSSGNVTKTQRSAHSAALLLFLWYSLVLPDHREPLDHLVQASNMVYVCRNTTRRPLGEIHGIHRSFLAVVASRDRHAHLMHTTWCQTEFCVSGEDVFTAYLLHKDEEHGLVPDHLAQYTVPYACPLGLRIGCSWRVSHL